MKKLNILGFIPARAGSKRITNKNIKQLCGKPLVAYTIEAAKKSEYLNRIVVSTDSKDIASISRQYGVKVPFLRPESISKNDSTEMEFFAHALNWFSENEKYEPDLIVLLYPTAPLRKPESIDRAIQVILKHPEADSLRSVKLCSEHPYKMWVIEDGYLKSFIDVKDPNIHTFSYQRLPQVYIQNANIYITKSSTIRNKQNPVGDKVIPFIMDEIESFDINIPLDFQYAEMIINQIGKEKET